MDYWPTSWVIDMWGHSLQHLWQAKNKLSPWPLIQVLINGGDSEWTALSDCQARLKSQPDLHPDFTTYLPSEFGKVISLLSVFTSFSRKQKKSMRVSTKHLGQCLAHSETRKDTSVCANCHVPNPIRKKQGLNLYGHFIQMAGNLRSGTFAA